MERSEIMEKIHQHRDELRGRFSIATSESDLDILISFQETPGLFKFLELKSLLETICQCPEVLVTEKALKTQLREQILREALNVI